MKRHAWRLLLVLTLSGCAVTPESYVPTQPAAVPHPQGSYYRVRRGDTLWSIARGFGLDVATLASVNRLPNASQLKVGQRLFVPTPSQATGRFLWPVRGPHRPVTGPKAVQIAVARGSVIRASRSGRVAVTARRLPGWGQTVILDHQDGYWTVYCGLEQIVIRPGSFVQQGMPIGSAGDGGLNFQIRQGTYAKDPLALLP